MAGPIHGSIEHQFTGAGQGSGSINTIFVNVYNFLNNNTGTLGTRRIAYNTGSTSAGAPAIRGMNFYDAALPAGDNAWACFAFTSASVPFYVLIQYAGSSNNLGTGPGAPGLYKNTSNTPSAMGLAFCQRADGGSPWNGSVGNNGSDTKGTPVWTSGTSHSFFVPRSNDTVRAGAHGSSRQNMAGFTAAGSSDYRMSMLADYDNFCILFDGGNNASYQVFIFGAVTPFSGVVPTIPYFYIDTGTSNLPFVVGAIGDIAGLNDRQGAMPFPNITLSGTCVLGLDRYGTTLFQNAAAAPNKAFTTQTYTEWPLILGVDELPSQVGIVGQAQNFYREVYNMATHDTNATLTRAVVGSATTADVKLTVPWNGTTTPGTGATRTGVQF